MKKEIISAIVSAIVTLIITVIFQVVGIFIWGDNAKIQLISSDYSNKEFTNIIAVKNMKKDEYLKNVSIEIDNNINVSSIIVDGKIIDNSNILTFDKIHPKKLSIIIIKSNKKISKNNISIVKNNQRISLEYFNDRTNFSAIYFILIMIYFIINLVLNLFSTHKKEKSNDSIKELYKQASERADNIERKFINIEKREIYRKKIYLKEMVDKEKELKFYQQLLLKQTGNIMTREQLEEFISKNLKTFSKKKIKYMDYEDVLKIIDNITRDN